VIDLDPKEAPFSDVVRTAVVFREICEKIGMPSYVKTTGKTGLHVLIPLGRQVTYAQCRQLGELLARVALQHVGDIATITRHVTKRGDKVYLDYLQNRHGQLIVAPFSVRPLPGASVSMPLLWDEVNQSLNPRDYTIKTAVERMERIGYDPCVQVLDDKPDLAAILSRLASMMTAG
jgi:bifunctional non-homologous end joining protein LigD